MKRNLYELLDGTEPAELEPLMNEPPADLPEGISLENIKSQAFQKTGLTKKRPFRWQHLAAMAACFCLIMASAWAIGKWQNRPLSDGEKTSPDANKPLQYGESTKPSTEDDKHGTAIDEGTSSEPPLSITLRSLEELAELRAMFRVEDNGKVEDFLANIEGGGVDSREDLTAFLDLIDSLPVLQLIDGTVSWIQQAQPTTPDSGRNPLFLTVRAENGESVLTEYHLEVTDIPAALAQLKANGAFSGSTHRPLLRTEDGRITVYAESREPQSSGEGDIITWYAEIDGIFVWIKYFTNDADAINTIEVFKDISIVSIADLEE